MYMDIDETRFISPISPQSDNEWDLNIDDNEQCQDIESFQQIEVHSIQNQTENHFVKIASTSDNFQGQSRFNDLEEGELSDNDGEMQLQGVDDWEKMYLDDDGKFIDANSSSNSSFGAFEIRNGDDVLEIQHITDCGNYEEDLVDGQEDEVYAAGFDSELGLPSGSEVNQDVSEVR
ncbi:uncharacterized protein LOC119078484 [Bradysia coprophila]|uniref:uncharacterized protein LOC119078484 n=1 Tax=Bradysia coprophila TaxID=38358 RepID=UPI00187DB36D|nr:uncharacterized protein LOC119078484 [Bradysia coprophila]